MSDVDGTRDAARQLREVEERLRNQQQTLLRLARSAEMGAGDEHATFALITEAAARTLSVERASIWLYDGARTRIRCLDLYEQNPRRHSAGIELLEKDYP